jgi:methionine synthase II (cobalamin-independent)
MFLAATIYHGHPALETVQRPQPLAGQDTWLPQSREDFWRFKIKDGVDAVSFAHLGYAHEAQQSYQDFCTLRAAGVIPSGVRFQVALPLTESATLRFLTNDRDFALMASAYEEAMGREIAHIIRAIPPDDLVIQWDIAVEVISIETQDQFGLTWQPAGDPFDRYLRALKAVAQQVPPQTLMGCHLCYGDFQHRHAVEPRDLRVVVRMANAAHQGVSRPIDYYHMPVPRHRDDEAYFAPLHDLHIGEAKLYLGLIHHTDGVAGARRRLAVSQKYATAFGIATECGFGRRPPETIPELLRIHREVAAML